MNGLRKARFKWREYPRYANKIIRAWVMEPVDIRDLKSLAPCGRAGSIPAPGSRLIQSLMPYAGHHALFRWCIRGASGEGKPIPQNLQIFLEIPLESLVRFVVGQPLRVLEGH